MPIDNTLKFNASDELYVNVTDVIDRLNETVEYYSNETGNEYDDGGHASMGEDYDTSAHRHIIHKVQIDINGADTSNGFWRAGVFAIDAAGTITRQSWAAAILRALTLTKGIRSHSLLM